MLNHKCGKSNNVERFKTYQILQFDIIFEFPLTLIAMILAGKPTFLAEIQNSS